MKFTLEAQDKHSSARAATIETDHGIIQTPIFMPVGTVGSVKTMHQSDLRDDIKAQIILGNTYHLYLRPGEKTLEKAGGLHRFIHWDKPILTDSGGYQVYSLAGSRKIKDDGVRFKSHIDGSYHYFSPERVMEIQRTIGADIIMAFDECAPYPCDYSYAQKAMYRTHNWVQRCVDYLSKNLEKYGYKQHFFPIVQGSVYKDLRTDSAKFIADLDACANAIGGLSVGEPHELMYEITHHVCQILPKDKPRYLMGVGTPVNILENIALGIDMMDCVMPTRNARNGMLFTWEGIINIKNKKWHQDFSPLDKNGTSFVDAYYTKAYVRHLFAASEYLAKQIATAHNLAFYLDLMRQARKHIIDGDFYAWKDQVVPSLSRRL